LNKKIVVLSVLVFSILLLSGCSKKKAEEPAADTSSDTTVKTAEKLSVITDSGDPVILQEEQLEEIERIEDSVNELNEEYSDAEINEVTAKPEEENQEKEEELVLDSNGKLILHSYDGEILVPVMEGDMKVLTYSNKKKIERNFYDQDNRFVKKEQWKISDIKSANIIKSEEYIYEENSFIPSNKIITQNNIKNYIQYNSDSKPVRNKQYNVITNSKTKETREALCQDTKYIYDSENRLIQQTSKEYEYSDAACKKLKSTFNKKITYSFKHGSNIPADYEYYENNILKIQKLYTAEPGNYTENIFFEDGLGVRTIYENSFKKKEIYTLNGLTLRESDYE